MSRNENEKDCSALFEYFRCLTYGLPRDGEKAKPDAKKEDKFDEKEYQRYEDIRTKINTVFDDAAEIFKGKVQVATPEEVQKIAFHFFRSRHLDFRTARLRGNGVRNQCEDESRRRPTSRH
jgi:hypothetical protein